MITTRAPRPALRPFVGTLWAMDGRSTPTPTAARERVLPTGGMHLAFRVSDPPFRFFDDAEPVGRRLGHAVVGGARVTPYLKDTSTAAASVGAQLLPGASELLFGVPAVELARRHVPLEAVWAGAAATRERLLDAGSSGRRLEILEEALAVRLPRTRGLHPAVAHALERFETGARVGEVVRETGYSHRRFIDLFRRSVGLGPKLFCRVRRFQRAFIRLSDLSVPTVQVAFETGYSDQAHLIRDFRDFAGITPGEYRKLGALRPGHVPVPPPRR